MRKAEGRSGTGKKVIRIESIYGIGYNKIMFHMAICFLQID